MPVMILTDLRAQFGPARDQDPRPTCMAFAASDAHAGARPGWAPLSVEWAYYHALKRDGSPASGGVTMTSMRATLREDGQPEEPVWPYIATEIDVSTYAPPVLSSDLFYRDSDDCGATVEAIIAELDGGNPVLIILSVSSSFDFGWDDDFVVAGSELPDPKRRHAVVVVGHGIREGRRLLLTRNSWGEHWANAGYAWIDLDYLKPRLLRASVLTKEL